MFCSHGPLVSREEVYKSIDAQGHVVYSDRPETSAAQKAVVNVDRPDAKEVARMGKSVNR